MTMRLDSSRRGLSMAELLVGMVILAIVGLSLTRIMVTQARYFDHQKKANGARNVSRGPLNRVVSDIRMVEALGGVVSANPTAITVRVPYAIGVVCTSSDGSGTHMSMLPVDSAMYYGAGYSGYAWRNGAGKYTYMDSGTLHDDGDLGLCNAAGIVTLTAEKGAARRITPKMTDTASVGTPVFIYRKILYEFKNSTSIPGTLGLFRTIVATNASEELSAPYESAAKFRFYVGSSTTAVDTPPAQLSTLRGIEMNMTGVSEKIASGGTQKERAPFVTAVFFKNRLN
ncbi:MAG: prepilin-type N-terminal cleavage/methylation domain-containing protein [Gemmatimonadales bacterium]